MVIALSQFKVGPVRAAQRSNLFEVGERDLSFFILCVCYCGLILLFSVITISTDSEAEKSPFAHMRSGLQKDRVQAINVNQGSQTRGSRFICGLQDDIR